MKTGLPRSVVIIWIGVTRSVSFDITAAASNSSFQASFSRWVPTVGVDELLSLHLRGAPARSRE